MDRTYLERIKTELVTDPKLKKPITERTKILRETLIATIPRICPERARLYTQSWKETEGEPLVIRRAKALEKILNQMSIFIRPGELIVGNHASEVRAAPLFPEFYTKFIVDELDGKPYKFDERPGDKFLVSEEAETELREIAHWWQGKTMTDYKYNLYPDEIWKGGYEIYAFDVTQHGENGGSGHFVVGYEKALTKGLNGLIMDAEEELSNLKLWEPQALRKAVIIVLRAAISLGKRFAALAREMAVGEADAERKIELQRIAEHCEWVPANPPRTFREAMQTLWFTHLIVQLESNGHSISYGRFDQYMYPFYKKDIEAGRITPEEVVELLECLWIKSTEINKLKSWMATRVVLGYIMFQNLTLGGQTKDGQSAINDLSWLALEATSNQKLTQPSVSVRYWDNMPEDFLLKSCEVINIHRGGQPAMFNDEVIIPSQLAVNFSLEDAYNYSICGCVEPTVGGRARKEGCIVLHNMLKVFELTLNNGKDPRTDIQMHSNLMDRDLSTFESFDELKAALIPGWGSWD